LLEPPTFVLIMGDRTLALGGTEGLPENLSWETVTLADFSYALIPLLV